jgi:hypothetical protein
MLSRVTNPLLMTATLVAVIIGSLCFSAGEGMRLTPFPSATLAEHSSDFDGTIDKVTVAKYGPLDVPTQHQKRGKRQSLDLHSNSVIGTRPVFRTVVHLFSYEAEHTDNRSFIAPHSGRAPPFQS